MDPHVARPGEERQGPFLTRVGWVLGSSLDSERTIADLLDLVVPEFADACSVHTLVEDQIRLAGQKFADEGLGLVAQEWAERAQPLLSDVGGVGRALREGTASFALDLTLPQVRTAIPQEALAVIDEFSIRSAIVVPVLGRDGGIAAISFLMTRSGRVFDAGSVDIAKEVARRAAVALENARLHETARLQAARAHLIAEASQRFARSLDPATTANDLLDLVVPTRADWGIVLACRPDGTLERVAFRHRESAGLDAMREIARRWPQGPRVAGPIATALEGKTVVLDPIPPDATRVTGVDDEHARMQASLGLGVSILIPLVAHGQVIGLVVLTRASARQRFSSEEVKLCEELGLRAGAAFHTATLHEQLTRLQRLTGRLAATTSVGEVATVLVDEAAGMVGATNAVLSLADEKGQNLALLRRHAVDEAFARPFATISVDADLPVSEAFRTGTDLYIESREELHARWSGARDAQVVTNAWAVLALRAEDRVLGALWFGFGARRTFDSTTRAFLRTMADHGAQSLSRAKLAEAALVRQQLLESQNEATLDGIFFQDTQGRPAFFNRRLVEIFDVSPDVPRQERLEERLASSMRSIADPAWFQELVLKMEKDPEARLRFDLHLVDGRVLDAYTTPVTSPDGARLGRAWYYRDVTDARRLQQELLDAQLQLAQREKLAAMGTLVSGVAHEIRTPLAYLANHGHLLRSLASRGPPFNMAQLDESASAITEGVERIDQLVQDLRRFTKVGTGREPTTSVDEALASAARLFLVTHPGRAALVVDLAAPVKIRVERVQLQQIILNLLENAADASPAGARVTLRSAVRDGQATVEVTDSGPGIPPDVQGRMWEPFFTTKKEGTGLGLSIVRRIVETNGGAASCASTPGAGARFLVSFPVARE